MKQISLAVLNYESSQGEIPPGYGFNQVINADSGKKAWGWGARILPELEQQNVSDVLGVNSREFDEALPGSSWSTWDPEIVAAMRAPLEVFRCPSDTGEAINTTADFTSASTPESHMPATSNYAGVYAYQYTNWYVGSEPPARTEGLFHIQNGASFSDIVDGTSNTFLVGERSTSHGAAYWIGVGHVGSEASWSSPKTIGRVFLFKPNGPLVDRYYSSFSSEHAGGLGFAFSDGSVHFIRENIQFSNGSLQNGGSHGWWSTFVEMDPNTFGAYQKLGCKSDGQPTPEF